VNVGPELESILKQTPESISPYIAIRGRVKELGHLIESSIGLKGVIERTTVNEHSVRRHSFGHWRDTVSQISQTQKDVRFALQEISSGAKGIIVEVITPGEAETESLLLPISTNFTPANATAASTVVGFFTGVASKGIETSEELLPVDTIVTGIGTVSKDSLGNLRLAPPSALGDRSYPFYLTQLPVETLIKKLENRRDTIRFFSYVFLALGLMIGSRRLFFLWKEYEMKKMREKILKRRNEIDAQGLSDAQICIVCLENPREVILLDCGHVCICADCVSKVNGKCPICRNSFSNTHAAYVV
jgi:E3 ubiquitin-protein ligase MUL1